MMRVVDEEHGILFGWHHPDENRRRVRKHKSQRFVEALDFLATPGYLSGSTFREAVGLPEGSDPFRVITQFGVYGFDDAAKRIHLLNIHPGVTLGQVREQSSFAIPVGLSVSTPPTPTELRILRDIDPRGSSLGDRWMCRTVYGGLS